MTTAKKKKHGGYGSRPLTVEALETEIGLMTKELAITEALRNRWDARVQRLTDVMLELYDELKGARQTLRQLKSSTSTRSAPLKTRNGPRAETLSMERDGSQGHSKPGFRGCDGDMDFNANLGRAARD